MIYGKNVLLPVTGTTLCTIPFFLDLSCLSCLIFLNLLIFIIGATLLFLGVRQICRQIKGEIENR